MWKLFAALCITAITLGPAARSQDNVKEGGPYLIPNTETFELRARNIGPGRRTDQTYEIRVALPESYGTDEQREEYPLIVLLDADYSFAIARNVVQHLSSERRYTQVPEAFVVAIAYPGAEGNENLYQMTRTRDYTPIPFATGGYGEEMQANSGGGPAFLDFIAGDLLPVLERRYPISAEDRTLSGHSYGGLFTTWALLTRPDLFSRWIIVSPSFWYADEFIFDLERSISLTHPAMNEVVVMSVGGNEINAQVNMVELHNRFAAQLETRGYSGLMFEHGVLPDETHASIWPNAISRSLRWAMNVPLPSAEGAGGADDVNEPVAEGTKDEASEDEPAE